MTKLYTEINIDAPIKKVWNILTDFNKYPEWNPFIKSITGVQSIGETLSVTIQPPGAKPMDFKPKITQITPEKEIRWLGHFVIPSLFDGEHIFELESIGDNITKFVQRENFKGLLVPLLRKQLENGTKQGFELMNKALKERAE